LPPILLTLLSLLTLATTALAQFTNTAAPESLNVHTVGHLRLGELSSEGQIPLITDLYIAGNHAYLGSFSGTVYIVDISDPTAMRLVAQVPTSGTALDLKVDGDLLAVGVQARSGDMGLVLIDLSDPTSPTVLSRFSQPGWRGVHNLFLHRNRAYLAHSAIPGLSVVDISNPRNPVVSGHWQHTGSRFSNIVHDIFIRDDIAFVSDIVAGAGGLILLDLQDPDWPQTLAALPMPDGIHSASVWGDYAYISQEFGGWQQNLYSIDISDLASPQIAHAFRAQPPPTADILGPHNPWAEDGLLYWAYYDGGVRIFDLANPAQPREIGYHTNSVAWGAQPHSDGLLYVADSSSGLLALRFNEPAHAIRQVQALPGAAVQGRYTSVLVTAQTAPSPRVSDSAIIQVSARLLDTEQSITRLDPIGNGAFSAFLPLPPDLANGRYQLHLELLDGRGARYPYERSFDLVAAPLNDTAVALSPIEAQPAAFALLPNFPNPFNSSTTIHYTLAARQYVELSLYNLTGQKLLELDHGERSPGTYSISWDGRDSQGRNLTSGLYLYQLRSGRQQQTRKLLLLR